MPALAVAIKLRQMGQEILWVGSRKGLENRLVVEQGFELKTLPVSALRGIGVRQRVAAGLRLMQSLLISAGLMLRFRPDLVLGMGSYVSGPGGLIAWLLRKPLVIHEQNAVPGFSNRILSRFARKILTAFPDVFTGVAEEIRVGNPVREELCHLPLPEERLGERTGALRVLILGGSQGARILNETLPATLATLVQEDYQVWHQTGKAHLDQVEQQYQKHNLAPRLDAFIDDMATALSWADLVICRSGALTLTEICAVGLASVLIPFAGASDDHQAKNAGYLDEAGAAVVIPEGELSAAKIGELLSGWSHSRKPLVTMANKARGLSLADVNGRVAEICMEVIRA